MRKPLVLPKAYTHFVRKHKSIINVHTEQRFIQWQQHVIFDPKRFWDVYIVQLRMREAHINSITQQIALTNPNGHWNNKKKLREKREKKNAHISTKADIIIIFRSTMLPKKVMLWAILFLFFLL